MKKILGIQKDHNASACLFYDEDLIYYNQEERLSRIKHDSGFPLKTVQEILKIAKEIDIVVISGYESFYGENTNIISLLKKLGLKSSNNFEVVVYNKSHHHMHAARAFYNSQFEEALVIVCDGKGSSYNLSNGSIANETTSIFSVTYPDKFNLVYRRLFTKSSNIDNCSIIWNNDGSVEETPIPRYVNKKTIIDIRNDFDLGFMYEGTSRSLGFDDEGGKMMGLQSFGKLNNNLPSVFLDDNCKFNMDIFRFDDQKKHRGFDTLRYPDLNFIENKIDFAYSIQKSFQEAGLKLIKKMLDLTGQKNVILTGGTALNVVANNYYKKNLPDDINLYVDPHCGDEGNCIGISQYFYQERYKKKTITSLNSMYLCGNFPSYEFSLLDNESEINDVSYNTIVELIKAGHIVSLFQGKAEAGPRALGNRSILFDPRLENGKDIVNTVKGREPFRPFAASIMLEHADDWFELRGMKESPYMMFALDVKEEKIKLIPAVVHVDKTCRIQTVTESQNFNLYQLLKIFYKDTGIPLLLNTSFNLAGDPIVETIEDALNSLRKSKLEYLYLPEIKKLIYIKN